jgi:hypothetical protein
MLAGADNRAAKARPTGVMASRIAATHLKASLMALI